MDSIGGIIFIYIVIFLVQASIWGWATNKIIENKGYYENWFWWGFFFGLIALIVALTKPDINRQQQISSYTPMYGNASNNTSSLFREKRVATGTEWTCAYCRRINQAFTGTCACGHSKSESDEKRRRDQAESQALLNARSSSQPNTFGSFSSSLEEEQSAFSAATTQKVEPKPMLQEKSEEEKVQAIRQYKALMDEGIISPEEFEAKKKQLLGI